MLVPRFSIRWLFGLTSICAIVFWILFWAMRGSATAMGVVFAFGSLAVMFLVHAALFGVAMLWTRLRGGSGATPFASDMPTTSGGVVVQGIAAADIVAADDAPPPNEDPVA